MIDVLVIDARDGPCRPGARLMGRLDGRVILVTGSTGIAAATAVRAA